MQELKKWIKSKPDQGLFLKYSPENQRESDGAVKTYYVIQKDCPPGKECIDEENQKKFEDSYKGSQKNFVLRLKSKKGVNRQSIGQVLSAQERKIQTAKKLEQAIASEQIQAFNEARASLIDLTNKKLAESGIKGATETPPKKSDLSKNDSQKTQKMLDRQVSSNQSQESKEATGREIVMKEGQTQYPGNLFVGVTPGTDGGVSWAALDIAEKVGRSRKVRDFMFQARALRKKNPKAYQKFLSGLTPKEMSDSLEHVKDTDPETYEILRERLIEYAKQQAKKEPKTK